MSNLAKFTEYKVVARAVAKQIKKMAKDPFQQLEGEFSKPVTIRTREDCLLFKFSYFWKMYYYLKSKFIIEFSRDYNLGKALM